MAKNLDFNQERLSTLTLETPPRSPKRLKVSSGDGCNVSSGDSNEFLLHMPMHEDSLGDGFYPRDRSNSAADELNLSAGGSHWRRDSFSPLNIPPTNENPFIPISAQSKSRIPEVTFATRTASYTDNMVPSSPEHVSTLPATPFKDARSPSPYSQRNDTPHDDENGERLHSRFQQDFELTGIVGSGSFGRVLRARMRLDGCEYAIKITQHKIRGLAEMRQMLREVFALSHLCTMEDAANIVRYHQAWIEDSRLYIQMELCERSLDNVLQETRIPFEDIFTMTRQVLLALEVLHRNNLVHLDIKPANIFIKHDRYKLGDLGLVSAAVDSGDYEVQEGDARYMSSELLQSHGQRDLTKCDIFSLGCTVYQTSLNEALPAGGPEWNAIRENRFRAIPNAPEALTHFVTAMMQARPEARPSASALLQYPRLQSPVEQKLEREQLRNQKLRAELAEQKAEQKLGTFGTRLRRSKTWN